METIKITFPDGSQKEFEKGITGLQIAQSISKKLAENALAIKVNEKVLDLTRPIVEDAVIKILTFDDKEGKEI